MEGDVSKILITQIKRTDQNRADLYARGHRFRDTTLFDLSELSVVGIDYQNLPIGQLVPCRFWTHVRESGKMNGAGRPYLDVVMLEPVEGGSAQGQGDLNGDANVALDDILTELRAIRALLTCIVPNPAGAPQAPAHVNPVRVPYQDPEPESERSLEGQSGRSPQGQPERSLQGQEEVPDTWPEERAELPQASRTQETRPARLSGDPELMDDDKARRLFSSIAGPAIRDRKVSADFVNTLTRDAVKTGWRDSYFALVAEIDKATAAAAVG